MVAAPVPLPNGESPARSNSRSGSGSASSPSSPRASGTPPPLPHEKPAPIATGRSGRKQHSLFGPYKLGRTLGEGEFGKVKLAVHLETKKEVAIKLIKKENIEQPTRRAKLMREISILQAVDHAYIVKVYEVIETRDYIGMIMEYASGGELFEHILAHRYLKERDACRFFAQLIAGVSYLHGQKIVHRDLKLENLLLDGRRNVIITDFGFANRSSVDPDQLLLTSCGSPCYAAPELVISDGYVGEAADIWSCGVILYAMLCGYLPFDDDPNNPDGDNINLLYKYILETELDFPDYVGEDARDLLKRMLVPDPRFRANMRDVMQHRWLQPFAYFYQEEQRRLEGADVVPSSVETVKKVPEKEGTESPDGSLAATYSTPPATPPARLSMSADQPIDHMLGVEQEDAAVPDEEDGTPMEVDTEIVDSMSGEEVAGHGTVKLAKSSSAMSGVEVLVLGGTGEEIGESIPSADENQEVTILGVEETVAVIPPVDGVDVVEDKAENPNVTLDGRDGGLSRVSDSKDSTYGSQVEEVVVIEDTTTQDEIDKALPDLPAAMEDDTQMYVVPTSVAESAESVAVIDSPMTMSESEGTLTQKRSQILERSDVRSVAFEEERGGLLMEEIGPKQEKKVEYGRKSLDVRRTESAASRKSFFGWLKKSGHYPPPMPEPRPVKLDTMRRPHSSVDHSPSTESAPRSSVHAPSVMSIASEWTVGSNSSSWTPSHSTITLPSGVPKVPHLRYHSGPIDQRALSSKPPSLVIAEVGRVLEGLGMEVWTVDDFKVKVTKKAAVAPQRSKSRRGDDRRGSNTTGSMQGPPVSFYSAVPSASHHLQSRGSVSSGASLAGGDRSLVGNGNELVANMQDAEETATRKHGPGKLAQVLASFPVHLVKKLRYMARYGPGYNKGFGRHEAAMAASHPPTLPYLHLPYAASRDTISTHHSTTSTTTVNSKEIRFTVEVQKIKNLPGLFVVEFKRIKGDVWEFKRLYQEIIVGLEGIVGVARQ
ncbi:CAMK/CAMKL/KIN4 protein kinase [Spizellomyces punctatus DAOM BR117]|uniref:non-specific serine/threonine protein kinase n=1 Tax=Spizellomyces punctatus (strain DAOM BR117) TaxID=645134 RepID=A0A0L0HFC2_SPIPD|nr:CAMK/CAMKL/KIN4 protein kinase [Spizellomyces punctatus DAOM BR117]KNC99827.1 CAMK/CAMKL/KIN4 protein kinase [Spizellomyces punctatus DAOM BR117]|eukprot:XP_016607867.1 CAMK/CAMKL/KIN4 protein kinase [Spizellomyces punctatus DAOM BR117]